MAMAARTLGEAICGCAESFPHRTAVTFRGHALSYNRVLGIAAAQAAVLRARGAAPGSRVVVYLDRGPDLVTSLLAVVLTGSTQLAVDPADPPARAQLLVADAAPQLVVTQPSLLPAIGSTAGYEVVLADDLPTEPGRITAVPGTPDEPAYMVYTSGSTGEPKASLISHRSLLSRLSWLQRRYPLAEDDRVLLKTACGFDVFIAELYWPLTAGATLVIAPPGGHRDPDYLARSVLQDGVTTLHFVPTLLDLFLTGRDQGERYDGLRRVMAGGEPLAPELVRRFYARSSATLHNLYGPSECAIYSTAWECPRNPDLSRVLIGGPVDGTELWVLDGNLRPVPAGTAGELFIGGIGVGNGYHARPELTAGRFVMLHLEGSLRRVYRTGDLVRDVGSGQLEYLGRVDTQIKIRGYRVEPGEIEVTMLRTGLARAAAVVPDATGTTARLVGFVVPGQPDADGRIVDELLTVLRRELPAYMVPAAIALTEELPLSPSGKVDRQELARRASAVRPSGPAQEPGPLTGGVAALAADIWKEHLGIEQVTAEDDFFLLGGDSMAAVQVVRSLAAKLNRPVPARALFDAPTLRDFIDYVSELCAASAG